MLYHLYEMQRVSLAPMRLFAHGALQVLDAPFNLLRPTPVGRLAAAALDSFEHSTRRFGKPDFGHAATLIDGEAVPVEEMVVASRPWCELKRFRPRRPPARRPGGADGGADVGPLRHPAARRRWRRSCPTMTCSSPTGATPATCP